jgi:hypothetical protein
LPCSNTGSAFSLSWKAGVSMLPVAWRMVIVRFGERC